MHNRIKQAVIVAGGRGERMRPFTDAHPKPLYPIYGKSFISRLIDQIKTFGIKRIVILLGYLAEQVMEELGDGSKNNVEITYDIIPAEFETGDRLVHALPLLDNNFLMMYCDNYCPIDFKKLEESFFKNNAAVQLSVYSNKDHYTRDNVIVNGCKVFAYDKSRKQSGLAGVDIGYAIIQKTIISSLTKDVGNFEKAVYSNLVQEGKLYAIVTDHRYYSIGSFERLPLTEEFFKEKKVAFLDRDGTINVKPPKACYVEKPEDFIWIPGAIEAIKLLNNHGVITILVTNQPGIARGKMKKEDLAAVHAKMQFDLDQHGAKIDHIYCCLHDWDDGCDCRKPKPGLLYQAQKELSLDLTKCVFFGDDERDIEAGNSAGCKSIMINESNTLLKAVQQYCSEMDG